MVKRAHLVTGKGGVGKSLFSVVLAHYFSTQNQSTLLTELSEHSFLKDYLNLPLLSYKGTPWKPNLDVSQWSPEDCLKEYALHLLKIESLYKIFIENPVSKSLIQIAPGLHELALLGKLTSSPRHIGPPMNYEQIVVDSYATGHFLTLIRAPSALNEAVPFGPMGEQSKAIDTLIRNSDFTQVHLVTIAEELPITESIELYQQLQKEFSIQPHVYLNKTCGFTEADLTDLPEAARESLQTVLTTENWARSELTKNGIKFISLPLVPSLKTDVLIGTLAQSLRDAV